MDVGGRGSFVLLMPLPSLWNIIRVALWIPRKLKRDNLFDEFSEDLAVSNSFFCFIPGFFLPVLEGILSALSGTMLGSVGKPVAV